MGRYLFIILLFVKVCSPQFLTYTFTEVTRQIAGIFDQNATTQLLAFQESVLRQNLINVNIQLTNKIDSYSTWRHMCSHNDIQPVAVFGPQNPISDGAVREQCALMNIPHIQATWQPIDPDLGFEDIETEADLSENNQDEGSPEETEEEEKKPVFKNISINFFPNSEEIAIAYGKLLKYYGWTSFGVLYEDNFGLLRVQKILSEISPNSQIIMRRLDPDGDNRQIFKEFKKNQVNRFLLDCHFSRILKYIYEAKDFKMLDEYQHCILVSMDTSTVAEHLTELSANISWYSLTKYEDINNANYLQPRVSKWNNVSSISDIPLSVTNFELEALVMDDIAKHIHTVVTKSPLSPPSSFSCTDNTAIWETGAAFQDQILKTKTAGVTGNIEFDEQGRRTNYTLHINEIYTKKRNTIGRWESVNPAEVIESRPDLDVLTTSQSKKHFIVVSRKAKPWFDEKENCEDCKGTNRYEGFSVDLVENLFQILRDEDKFDYTYEFLDLGSKISYGKQDTITKKWSGLIGELLEKRADLAVCDLTITEERKQVVDFSVPFMTLGISILFTKDHKLDPEWFSFLKPYTLEVWMYTATAYCVVSVVLYICSRISPADWENPEPCEKDPEELENIWTFKNCAWLTMGSIMTQGCDILPKALGTRWVCGMWWFFAMIVCQTYIAQLSASMTSAMENEPINSIEDLANQNKILYGAITGGSTFQFFQSSSDKMLQQMYQNMVARPAVMVGDNEEGERRVIKSKSKYAFFMESTTIEYKMKRECSLKKVGGQLDSKDYGIGMPANSPFRTHINRAILKLKEHTKLDEIKDIWWNQRHGAQDCPDDTVEGDMEGDLEMANLIGLFVVLIVGLFFCLILTAMEFMNEVRNIVIREQVPQKEVFLQELKASLNFFQLQKPVIRNASRAPSIDSNFKADRLSKRADAISNFLEMEKEEQ